MKEELDEQTEMRGPLAITELNYLTDVETEGWGEVICPKSQDQSVLEQGFLSSFLGEGGAKGPQLILSSWGICFFFFFSSFLAAPQHMEFLGQGSDPSHSCNLS